MYGSGHLCGFSKPSSSAGVTGQLQALGPTQACLHLQKNTRQGSYQVEHIWAAVRETFGEAVFH